MAPVDTAMEDRVVEVFVIDHDCVCMDISSTPSLKITRNMYLQKEQESPSI